MQRLSFFCGPAGLNAHNRLASQKATSNPACRVRAVVGAPVDDMANEHQLGEGNAMEINEEMANYLMGFFRLKLDSIHDTWQEPFYATTTTLLEAMGPGPDCHLVTLAFFLLPGVIAFMASVKTAGKPVHLLRRLAQCDAGDLSRLLLGEAQDLKLRHGRGELRPRRIHGNTSLAGGLIRQITSSGRRL